MGTAAPTAPWEVLWIICQTDMNMFWRPLSLLPLSALRLTPTCLATTDSATPAILASLTLVLDVTSPTLLELSMLPRGRLRLIPTFWDMAATQATDMPASAMPGTGTQAMLAMLGMAATALTHPLLV